MNKVVDKFLLGREKFNPEMHLRQPAAFAKPGFAYTACEPFTKKKERIEKFNPNKAGLFEGSFFWWVGSILWMKYYAIKHLILLRLQIMIDINQDLFQWFINAF